MAGNGRLGGGPGQGGYLEPAGILIVVIDGDGSGVDVVIDDCLMQRVDFCERCKCQLSLDGLSVEADIYILNLYWSL